MIAIAPSKMNPVGLTDEIVDQILTDIKESESVQENGSIYYPGERELITREENLKNGIPVMDELWETLNLLEKQTEGK
ncbi:Malate/L-lactate dehydrogenase [Clostridiales bacterium CHKCI001]|nr:Malate/L-lactate dehydrogenase [Clostridiales bacterium CHKCI001]